MFVSESFGNIGELARSYLVCLGVWHHPAPSFAVIAFVGDDVI